MCIFLKPFEKDKTFVKKGSEEIIEVDLIIEALGFEPEELPVLFNESALNVTKWGTLKIDFKNMMTSIEGVFAAGDIIRGASLVVWGIKDGRDAAKHIHKYIYDKEKFKNMQNELNTLIGRNLLLINPKDISEIVKS